MRYPIIFIFSVLICRWGLAEEVSASPTEASPIIDATQDAAAPDGSPPPIDDAPGDGEHKSVSGSSLYEQFHRGGTWMYPILFCSFVLVAFALERLVNLRKSRIIPPGLASSLNGSLASTTLDQVTHECKLYPSCLSRIVMAGLERSGFALAEMERVADEQSRRELYGLRRNIRPLGIVATVAPMLGLLGTVYGMVSAFDVVAKHGALGDPKMLSGSISTALLTTGFGLTIAIPSLILHHYFRGRAELLIVEISDITNHVFVRFEGQRQREDAKDEEDAEDQASNGEAPSEGANAKGT